MISLRVNHFNHLLSFIDVNEVYPVRWISLM